MSNLKRVREADIAVQAENERLRRDWDRLSLERKELTHEIETLREENTDLRESALLWIHLYECALARANAGDALQHPGAEPATQAATAPDAGTNHGSVRGVTEQ